MAAVLPAGAGAAPLLIVTRAAEQAAAWVLELQALGCAAQALPLIHITAAPDAETVRQAWLALPGASVVMFVSANAVQGFFACKPLDQSWPQALLAASTGPGTSAELRAMGLVDSQIVQPAPDSPLFDSEALWQQLRGRWLSWQDRQVLVVRGGTGRDWLADTLRAHGAQVCCVAAYQRQAAQPDAAGLVLLAAAQERPLQHVWLFSASAALAHLRQLVPQAVWSRSQAWVTHPRIGRVASDAGFGSVLMVRPGAIAAAQQLHSGGWQRPLQSAAL